MLKKNEILNSLRIDSSIWSAQVNFAHHRFQHRFPGPARTGHKTLLFLQLPWTCLKPQAHLHMQQVCLLPQCILNESQQSTVGNAAESECLSKSLQYRLILGRDAGKQRGSLSCTHFRERTIFCVRSQPINMLELLAQLCNGNISSKSISLPVLYAENGSLI